MTAEDKVKRKRDEDNENDLDKHGMTTHGRCVWVNWKSSVRAKAMYWPAVALHPLHDHAVIPAAVRTSEYSKKFNNDHRLVMFFDGKRSCAWVKASETFPFDKFYAEAMKQPAFSTKAKFTDMIELAQSWCNAVGTLKLLRTPSSRATTCACLATQVHAVSATRAWPRVSKCQVKRRRRRGHPLAESACSPQGEKSKSLCPQIKIIELARAGNIGAVLALRKQYAVGQRLVVFWHRDNAFFLGVITEFDSHKNSFRVDYDDGDIDLDFKPWTESIMIAQDVPKSADVVGATELKNSNAKNALEAKIKRNRAEVASPESPLDTKTMRRDDSGAPVQLQT